MNFWKQSDTPSITSTLLAKPGAPVHATQAHWGLASACRPQPVAIPVHKSPALSRTLPASLASFAPITLVEMQEVALLDRIETKYVMHDQTLLDVLSGLQPYYRVLSVAGERLSRYQTLYYDTPDFALYYSHHAGLGNRYKVRTREYVDSAQTFLEVKHRTNKNRTLKHRLPIADPMPDFDDIGSGDLAAFLRNNTPYPVQTLQPVLWNRYRRITLVGKETVERITLDVDLNFFWQGKQVQSPQLVIAEVKQAGRHQPSPFTQQLRLTHVHEGGFSKYCMGVTLLYPSVKANRFKKKQRQINKLLQTAPGPERTEPVAVNQGTSYVES